MSHEPIFLSGRGFVRSAACTAGFGLLVGGLVYGFSGPGLRDDDSQVLGALCGIGAALAAWSLTIGWFTREDPATPLPPDPLRRGFEVIRDATEANDDR